MLVFLLSPCWPPFEERSIALTVFTSMATVTFAHATVVIGGHGDLWMQFQSFLPGVYLHSMW